MRTSIAGLLICATLPLRAQTPYLVKDINSTLSLSTQSSSPSDFASFGNRIFFAATLPESGTELWSTDGTSSGTSMVADIIPGTGSSNPAGFVVVNGVLLFNARDVNSGVELWTTDGTPAGTHLFLDLNPGPNSSQPAGKVLYKNRMLFSADDGTHGRELWITDGTVSGTHMVKDIASGSASSSPAYLVTMGDSVYFSAAGGLWKTDGTDAGTVQIAAVAARHLTVAGSQLFFEGDSGNTGWELWVSDGSASGIHLVTEIMPGSIGAFDSPYSALGLTAFGDRVLFPANDGIHGREMWISDGTAAGTRMVRDFVPGAKGMWDSGYAWITTLGDRAYFIANDSEHGRELWVTDGTDNGTMLFADLSPGPTSSSPFDLVVSGGKLFFAAEFGLPLGIRLWVSDGTIAGTHRLGDASSLSLGYDIVRLWPVDGKVYFGGSTRLTGVEPWVTDGTDAGTTMIANLAHDAAPSSNPGVLTAAGDLLFFYAIEGALAPSNIAGVSLWRSDGTTAGTFKLMESGQHPDKLIAAGPLVFLQDPVTSSIAFVSDGTPEGTKSANDFLRRFGGYRVNTLFPFGDTLFASVVDLGVYDSSLWKTTVAPNAQAVRLGSENPSGLIDVVGHKIFYAEGSRGLYNYGLWTSDGTREGTYAIVPDLGDTAAQRPSDLATAAGTIFFLKQLRDEKTKLWKSDGTVDGTMIVKELPSSAGAFSSKLAAAGRRLFFLTGGSLWSSDGTGAGTIELMKIKSSPFAYDNLIPVGNRLLFAVLDDANDNELFSTDGSVAGTKLLVNLGKRFPQITSAHGVAYFAGTDDAHGTELWITDGTPEGTKFFFDVNPGSASSNPGNFTTVGNLLYFNAYTDTTGAELWALPLTQPSLSINDARIIEGDSQTRQIHFPVTLSMPAQQSVTVDYATSDGSAQAGQDYDPASGTLTFAPGEISKSIDVSVRGDFAPEGNETFFVTLRNEAGASVTKSEAVGIIDDDDQSADITVSPQFRQSSFTLNESALVTNNGPNGATDIVVRVTSTPAPFLVVPCTSCSIPQLAPGTSATAATDSSILSGSQTFLSATATARQRDPNASNNSVAWTINTNHTMAMDAAYLVPGATATVTAVASGQSPVTSSDPSVISVPSTANAAAGGLATVTVTALKPGTSLINVAGQQYPLVVTVTPAGGSPRWPGGVSVQVNFSAVTFDRPLIVTVTPSGTAPITGATATGTVVMNVGMQELVRQNLTGTSSISFPIYLPSLGSNAYQITYSGDANFLPQTVSGTVFVNKGSATLNGVLFPVRGQSGTFSLRVNATGSPLADPTGTLSIVNGSTEVARLSLKPSGGGTSTAEALLTNLPVSPTLTINYLGDSLYISGSQQVRSTVPRGRVIHH